jgi:hypothetical protein
MGKRIDARGAQLVELGAPRAEEVVAHASESIA